ncbi:MAG: hypothetical protein R2794_12915 [Chitinophagales bacterium]
MPEQINILTGNVLVDRIGEITHVPLRSYNRDTEGNLSVSFDCGDALFWEIVQLGKDAIPDLIKKVEDNTGTQIPIPCRQDTLTQGMIAFMILEQIIEIPYYQVFGIQWDVFDLNCDFVYPQGFIDFVQSNPVLVHEKLKKWYATYNDSVSRTNTHSDEWNDCQ